ncbi:response regulator [Desulfobacterales bacterium HSG2]|nr:response regulator [Desulfobacterales bacterium HSG2]
MNNAHRVNILIADDTPENLRLLSGLLTDQGYEVRPAPNGRLALSGARTILPDLILLDIRMPDLDGYEVCKALKADERTRDIPVIFISVLNEAEDKVKAFSVGGVDFITKPFQEEEVLARVRTHLRIRELQRDMEQEIKERRESEESLRTERERFFSTLEKIPAFVYLQAPDHTIRYANMKFRNLFGDPEGRLCYEVIRGRDKPCEVCPTFEVFKTEETQIWEWKRDNDETYMIHDSHLADTDGSPLVLKMGVDITVSRQTGEMLRERTEDLERSNRDLEQFAHVVSHDLQEPLRMVSSYVQLLERRYKGKLDADADDFIAFAVDGAVRMHALITDLLAFSRVGTRGKPFEPLEAEHILEQVLANLSVSIRESGAEVTHDALPSVIADASQLARVFQNLISNAIKFRGEEPPRIHVTAEKKGREWIFSLRDKGIGIAPKYSDRIFVIFQRLHTRDEYPGTGMGLAICKRIVERHRGRIWVESREGAGSTFHFTIAIPERI